MGCVCVVLFILQVVVQATLHGLTRYLIPNTLVSIHPKKTGAYPDLARKLCEKRLPLDVQLETAVAIIKKAYSQVPSYDSLLDAILNVPLQEVHKACELTPGIPVQPMLAKPTKSVQEVLKRLTGLRFTCEYKYDGERAQVRLSSVQYITQYLWQFVCSLLNHIFSCFRCT